MSAGEFRHLPGWAWNDCLGWYDTNALEHILAAATYGQPRAAESPIIWEGWTRTVPETGSVLRQYEGTLPYVDGVIRILNSSSGMKDAPDRDPKWWEAYCVIDGRRLCSIGTDPVFAETPEEAAKAAKGEVIRLLNSKGIAVNFTEWVPDFTRITLYEHKDPAQE